MGKGEEGRSEFFNFFLEKLQKNSNDEVRLANASIDKLSKCINLFSISVLLFSLMFTRSSKRIFKM